MKYLMLFSIFLSVSSFAQGGGTSVGPSFCSYGAYTCSTSDHYTTVCIFPDKNSVLITLRLANGGDFSNSSNIESVVQGSITTYETPDLTLKILYGINTADGKLPAYLTFSSAGMNDMPMSCIQNSNNIKN